MDALLTPEAVLPSEKYFHTQLAICWWNFWESSGVRREPVAQN